MTQNLDNALAYSKRWLGIIKQNEVDETLGMEIIAESRQNFAGHFNKGWLDYRKSVSEAGDWAAVEWTGCGAVFKDVRGRFGRRHVGKRTDHPYRTAVCH
jgi:putrescine aminotransferase